MPPTPHPTDDDAELELRMVCPPEPAAAVRLNDFVADYERRLFAVRLADLEWQARLRLVRQEFEVT